MAKVLIFVDKRELASGIRDYFSQFECVIHDKMLVSGDYIVSDRIAIERKTTSDFVKSIIDRRLFQQLKNMKENFEKPLLIIEGKDLYGTLHPNAIRGALASITFDYEVPIIWTKTLAETAGMIYWIARKEQIDHRREVPIRGSKKAQSPEQEQEYLVHGLPGISIVRARSLLEHFKTPVNIFNASEKELKGATNVGPKTAKTIRKILEREYIPKKK
ncbi:MAG: hypothetical protein GOV02_03760 [Candidatus Aenigmarchaeota archaeon]|nr:hypothetical protein [Candidatus Aenigmarchaeota archaeon]